MKLETPHRRRPGNFSAAVSVFYLLNEISTLPKTVPTAAKGLMTTVLKLNLDGTI